MQDDIGKLVLRVSVGGLVLMHGINKLLNGIDGIKSAVTSHGLPEAIAYGVYVGELVAPVLVIVGLFARVGGALVAANMVVAIGLVHMVDIAAIDPASGGYKLELQALFLLGGLAVALLGAGRLSVGGGRLN